MTPVVLAENCSYWCKVIQYIRTDICGYVFSSIVNKRQKHICNNEHTYHLDSGFQLRSATEENQGTQRNIQFQDWGKEV